MKQAPSRLSFVAKLALFAVLLLAPLELRLRLFSPSPYIAKGQKVILPANKVYVYVTHGSKHLDPVIYVKKNALGFRGPERPQNPSDYCSLIFVGGSSLASDNLTDGKTWVDDLDRMFSRDFKNVWINNAGFMGHSTIAHILMMDDYISKLKPNIVVFFVGENEIDLSRQKNADEGIIQGKWHFLSLRTFALSLVRNSETANLAVNALQNFLKRKRPGAYGEVDFKSNRRLLIPPEKMAELVAAYKKNILPDVVARIQTLVDICKKNNIQPVFLTFTALYNGEYDAETGVKMDDFEVYTGRNVKLTREILRVINDKILALRSQGVVVIDIDKKMPKSTRYFSDFFHFTNAGAEEMAKAIYPELKQVVEANPVTKTRN